MNEIQFTCLIIAGILMYSVGIYQGYKYKEHKVKMLGLHLAEQLLNGKEIHKSVVIYLLMDMYRLKINK